MSSDSERREVSHCRVDLGDRVDSVTVREGDVSSDSEGGRCEQ